MPFKIWSRSLNREQKEIVVKELGQIFSESGVVVVAHYSGLTVSDMSQLRIRMRNSGSSVKVAKNRLSKIALDGKPNAGLIDFLQGQTVLLFSDDPLAAVKVAVKFSEENENTVRYSMPISRQASTVRLSASTPRSWPT